MNKRKKTDDNDNKQRGTEWVGDMILQVWGEIKRQGHFLIRSTNNTPDVLIPKDHITLITGFVINPNQIKFVLHIGSTNIITWTKTFNE